MDKQIDENKAKPQNRDYADKKLDKNKDASSDKAKKGSGSSCGC